MIFWKEFSILQERASLLPIIFAPSGRMIGRQRGTRTSPVESFVWLLTFLSTTSTFVLEALFSGRLLVYQWAPTVHLYWLISSFEYDFMVKTMKQDISKAIQFSNTFRYIDDLFSVNNLDFGNYISAIHPSELELKDTSTSSTEVCYLDTETHKGLNPYGFLLDTNIKTGDNTPFRISIYDKREDFAFRIVNFPHMDSNIPANPAYGVYISQLVRYARICTSKVDFINRLRGLSLRLRQQGFETNLLQKSFNKFFSRHGLIIEKYGAALREMRLAIQA